VFKNLVLACFLMCLAEISPTSAQCYSAGVWSPAPCSTGFLTTYLSGSGAAQSFANTGTNAVNNIVFNTSLSANSNLGGDLDGSTGIITLPPGVPYGLSGSVGIINPGASSSLISVQWFNITSGAFIGNPVIINFSPTNPINLSGPAVAFLTPSVSTQIQLRVTMSASAAGAGITSASIFQIF
jgi:hypothetical protein